MKWCNFSSLEELYETSEKFAFSDMSFVRFFNLTIFFLMTIQFDDGYMSLVAAS